MSLTTEEIVVIVLCCVIFVVALLILFVFIYRRYFYVELNLNGVSPGDASRAVGMPMVVMSKPPGRYHSPLILEIYPNAQFEQCDIYVKIIHESNTDVYRHYFSRRHSIGGFTDVSMMMTAAEGGGENDGIRAAAVRSNDEVLRDRLMGYLLYTKPLQLVRSGDYIVRVHTLMKGRSEAEADLSDVRQYHYTVMREDEGSVVVDVPPSPASRPAYSSRSFSLAYSPLAPPRIIPDSGEVTDITPIKIVLAGGLNNTVSQVNISRFSSRSEAVGGRGVVVGGGGAEHILYSIDNTFPSVMYTGPFTLPIPRGQNSARHTIRAVATDGTRSSEVKAATLDVLPHSAVTYDPSIPAPTVQVEAVGAMLYFETPLEVEAVVEYQLEYDGERAYFANTTDGGEGLGEDYFEGVKGKERLLYQNRAIELMPDVRRIYAWTVPRGGGGRDALKESRPAIYEVSLQRFVPHPKARKASTRRCAPPIMCVQCSDVFLTFDEPPAAYKLLYTLDGTEPSVGEDALSTKRYRPGAQPIDINKCAEGSVTVTARYFTRPDERGLTRFGDRFSRGFHSTGGLQQQN